MKKKTAEGVNSRLLFTKITAKNLHKINPFLEIDLMCACSLRISWYRSQQNTYPASSAHRFLSRHPVSSAHFLFVLTQHPVHSGVHSIWRIRKRGLIFFWDYTIADLTPERRIVSVHSFTFYSLVNLFLFLFLIYNVIHVYNSCKHGIKLCFVNVLYILFLISLKLLR